MMMASSATGRVSSVTESLVSAALFFGPRRRSSCRRPPSGGVEVGHGEAFGTAGPDEPTIAPLSPATISVFLATFGGTGIILTSMFKLQLYYSLPISAAAGAAVGAFVVMLFYHLFTKVQSSSEPHIAELVGLRAEVTVPIPKDGVGEVAFICRGSRLVSPARSQAGVDLPRRAAVRIARQVGGTMYVSPLTEEESREAAPETAPPNFRD
jgi:membrane protein implicated in regulation of membrane protease activity